MIIFALLFAELAIAAYVRPGWSREVPIWALPLIGIAAQAVAIVEGAAFARKARSRPRCRHRGCDAAHDGEEA